MGLECGLNWTFPRGRLPISVAWERGICSVAVATLCLLCYYQEFMERSGNPECLVRTIYKPRFHDASRTHKWPPSSLRKSEQDEEEARASLMSRHLRPRTETATAHSFPHRKRRGEKGDTNEGQL